MRWMLVVACLSLGVATSVGCKQQCFMSADDFNHYRDMGIGGLETAPGPSIVPATTDMAVPGTILDPERKIRYMTLAECIAIALEQGTTGVQSPFFPGSITDLLVQFNGRGVSGSDNIRVLALQPSITATDIEASLSKFDARWVSSMTWQTTDQPVANALQTIQARGLNVIKQDTATYNSSLIKPLPTGGVAGITFNTTYTLSNLPQRLNPAYQPTLTFSFEQPLLQGYGTEINQLRSTHPGSLINPFPTGGRVEGILITRLRFDQSRAEFERNLNYLLVNVEIGYWNLYGSYWTLYSREQGLRQAYEAWKINKAKYDAGRSPVQDLAQSRQQYELFRGQRIAALGDVLEKERQLRGFLNLAIEDGDRLVPIDTPTLAPYTPDWHSATNEALALRPELVLARNDLKFRQLDLVNQKNQLMPDLRFLSTYGYTGIGSRLDGPDPDANAFRSLATGDFANWNLGLQLTVPIGYRDANAAVRAARLNLAQSYIQLQDQEQKALRYLAFQYRKLFETYEQVKAQRAQREAAAIQLEARFKSYLAGRDTLDILLESQRVWADALKAEFDNIVLYNSTLAGFEFAKGTIQQRDNVLISEGPLPGCAQVRAVEHERERAKALLVRERANPIDGGGRHILGLPTIPTTEGASLPALETLPDMFKDKPTLPDVAPGFAPTTAPQISTSGQPLSPKAVDRLPELTPANFQSQVPTLPAARPVVFAQPATPTPAEEKQEAPRVSPKWTSGSYPTLSASPSTTPAAQDLLEPPPPPKAGRIAPAPWDDGKP